MKVVKNPNWRIGNFFSFWEKRCASRLLKVTLGTVPRRIEEQH